MNVQFVANLDGRVLDTSTPIGSSRHDSVVFVGSGIAERWAELVLLEGPGLSGGKGYQGTGARTLYKKPQSHDLTEPRKSYNHSHSSIRAAVEQAISHMTNWKILDIGYRRRLCEFPEILYTVTNLEIYRVWA